jgi:hypothetical protein
VPPDDEGLVILVTQEPDIIPGRRFVRFGIAAYASGLVMVAFGLAFTVWARGDRDGYRSANVGASSIKNSARRALCVGSHPIDSGLRACEPARRGLSAMVINNQKPDRDSENVEPYVVV